MSKAPGSARAGRTEKVSISLDRSDLAVLRKRARARYAGNLSAVVAEGVRRIQEEEGREALVRWLGDAAVTTAGEREAILAEWLTAPVARKRRRRPAA
jgi:Arc/MetJ-type ribon-helix-helix transcriptional regulator